MSKGLGRIQREILTVLRNMDERYIERGSRELRWVWLNVLIIMVYHPKQLQGEKSRWNWNYSVNEHRRIWESVRTLEKRGLVECRIRRVKVVRLKVKFGGCTRWMEVRIR